MEFYICKHCGNIITHLDNSGVPVVCCGEAMTKLAAGTTDGAHEKHIPVYEHKDGKLTVKIGSAPHPMVPEHYIEWVVVETNDGFLVKYLKPNTDPEVVFDLSDDAQIKKVYEYCNIHGLWVNQD